MATTTKNKKASTKAAIKATAKGGKSGRAGAKAAVDDDEDEDAESQVDEDDDVTEVDLDDDGDDGDADESDDTEASDDEDTESESDDEADDDESDDDTESDDDDDESEDAESEDDDDEDTEDTEDTEASDEADTPKSGKAKAKPTAAASKVDDDDDKFEWAEGFGVVEFPIADLKPGKLRAPTEAAVAEMSKSIRANGLQNPIVIGADGVVVSGNTRLAAFKAMGRKTIPARFAFDPKSGNRVKSGDTTALFQSLVENINRTDLTPMQRAKAYKHAIDSGAIDSAAELATRLGVSKSSVSRILGFAENASKTLQQAVDSGQITENAAMTLVTRAGGHKEQDALLATLMKASEGKISVEQVNGATGPAARKKGGRKPSIAALATDSLNSEETGFSAKLRRNADKSYQLILTAELDIEIGEIGRFDLVKVLQRRLAKVEIKALRAELAVAHKRIVG